MDLYEPLILAKREFRLLSIAHPDTASTTPHCLLQTYSFDDAPPFFALSYTWGDITVNDDVVVNGITVQKTTNCIAALNRIRQLLSIEPMTEDVRHIWIDAICINQDSLGDKSSQIPFMRDIYSKARRVLVWLGEKSNDSDVALDFLAQLGHLQNLHELSCVAADMVPRALAHDDGLQFRMSITTESTGNGMGDIGTVVSFRESGPHQHRHAFEVTGHSQTEKELLPAELLSHAWLSKTHESKWMALEQLFSRPYWTRAWIIQELGLARGPVPPLLICGRQTLSWVTFIKAFKQITFWVSSGSMNRSHEPKGTVPSKALQLGSFIRTNIMTRLESISWLVEDTGDKDLTDLVALTSNCQCRDPRDKVYCVLGLLSPTEVSVLVPDYSQSIKHVYIDFVLTEIQRTQRLDVLGLNHQQSCDKVVEGLPSWVPDLSSKQTQAIRFPSLMLSRKGFRAAANASLGKEANFEVSEDLLILRLKGIRCSVVKKLQRSQGPHHKAEDNAQKGEWDSAKNNEMQTWLGFALENLPRTLPSGLPTMQVFFRTLLRDLSGGGPPNHDFKSEEERDQLRRLAAAWYHSNMMFKPQHELYDHNKMLDDLEHIIRNKQPGAEDPTSPPQDPDPNSRWGFGDEPFVLGLTREIMSLMDIVVPALFRFALFVTEEGYLGLGPRYIKEGDILVVLLGSRSPVILRPVGDEFVFLGDSYVYDFMNGQAVRQAEEGKREIESFTLR